MSLHVYDFLHVVSLLQYEDNYYRAALIQALANTVTPAVTTVTVTGFVHAIKLQCLVISNFCKESEAFQIVTFC